MPEQSAAERTNAAWVQFLRAGVYGGTTARGFFSAGYAAAETACREETSRLTIDLTHEVGFRDKADRRVEKLEVALDRIMRLGQSVETHAARGDSSTATIMGRDTHNIARAALASQEDTAQ